MLSDQPSDWHDSPLGRRILEAQRDLQQAENIDLATADPAQLVLTVERLRGSLADMIRIARHCRHLGLDQG